MAATESEIWTVGSQEIIVAKSQKYGHLNGFLSTCLCRVLRNMEIQCKIPQSLEQ